MDLQPPKPLRSNRFALRKLEHTSVDIRAHMVQVRRYRVDSTSEVTIMWEVNLIACFETLSD